ncbi:tigger transposable element-derived protein 4 [Schistocerca piceifrons]|uniref:tigger transposable element-derived protein 4 n=1 Tax=Schistocerca piceifrons TaxID=274613 RepID=UPI001F5EA63A|nr:tigger transposable element-derived protein 4 [Schistocerca piceifrons]
MWRRPTVADFKRECMYCNAKMSQKWKQLPLNEKLETINVYKKETFSVRDMAMRFPVGKAQISDILRKRNGILKSWIVNLTSKCASPNTPGLKDGNFTFELFCHAHSNNLPVSGPLICEKAFAIAKELGLNDFKDSVGWLDKFKSRHNSSFLTIYDESSSVDENTVMRKIMT